MQSVEHLCGILHDFNWQCARVVRSSALAEHLVNGSVKNSHNISTEIFLYIHPCLKKLCVKFTPILIIFDSKMAKRLKLCKTHPFSASPNIHHHTTAADPGFGEGVCYFLPLSSLPLRHPSSLPSPFCISSFLFLLPPLPFPSQPFHSFLFPSILSLSFPFPAGGPGGAL